MLKPLALLAFTLAAASAFAAPSKPAQPETTDPVQSLLDLDQQLSAARTDTKKKPALEDFREELPVSVNGQKDAELEKLPLGPEEE